MLSTLCSCSLLSAPSSRKPTRHMGHNGSTTPALGPVAAHSTQTNSHGQQADLSWRRATDQGRCRCKGRAGNARSVCRLNCLGLLSLPRPSESLRLPACPPAVLNAGCPAIRSSRRSAAGWTQRSTRCGARLPLLRTTGASDGRARRRALHPSRPSTHASPLTPYLNTLDPRHPRRREALASLPHLQRSAGSVPGGERGSW